jgi:hypothetical protein
MVKSIYLNERPTIGCKDLSSRMSKNLTTSSFLKSLAFSFAFFLFCFTSIAQKPAQCGNLNCTATDVVIVRAKIADANGNFFTCQGTEPVNGAYLYLYVTTSTPRIGAFVSLTLRVGQNTYPIQHCFTGATLIGVEFELKVPITNGTFTCSSAAQLENIFTAWGTGNTDFCMGSTGVQCPATKSKCRFVPGEVIVVQTTPCSLPVITQNPANDIKCAASTALFTAKFNEATGPIITTSYKWQVCTDGTCATDAAWTDVPISSPYSETSSITNGVRTTTLSISNVATNLNGNKYRVLVTNTSSDAQANPKTCPNATIAATLNVDNTTVGGTAAATSPICSGTGTTVSLSGQTGSVQKWQSSTNGTDWSDINSTANSISTGNLTVATQFRAVVKSGVCNAVNSIPATVSVDANSVGGTAAATSPICSGTGTSLTLSGQTGTIQKWQRLVNGNWEDISNSATSPLSTGNLTATTQYRAVVKNGVCGEANSAPVTISVDAQSSAASVGNTQERCGTLVSTSLGGNTPQVGNGTWSKKSGPGTVTFSDDHSGSATATVSVVGSYVFTWTIANGTCASSSADITVNYYNLPPNPGGTVTPPTCTNANGTVTITAPVDDANNNYEYKNNSGDWTDETTFTVAAGTGYSLVVRNKTTHCVSQSAFSGTMAAQPATPGIPEFSKTNATCSAGGSITITNYNASCAYTLTGPSPATTSQTLSAATTQNIAQGVYTLTASLTTNSATCTSGPASITIGAPSGAPATPTVGVKQAATCSSAGMIIEVTGPTPLSDYEFKNGTGDWQSSNEFTINAGDGYEIYVRRKSDNTCVSTARTCTSEGTISSAAPNREEQKTQRLNDIDARILGKARVLAAPNPFTDKVRFTLQSDVSGQGSLEIYNAMGQKIHTVYQGYVEAGKQLVKEYNVPLSHRQSLIYIFKVGDQKTTGKLLNW